MAKFWLEPVRLQNISGFRSAEIKRLYKLIQLHQEQLVRAWNDYFSD